ncbi:hypothetical protein OEZ85_008106 [Tetradesmus obliquus]|uniref:tRNA-uridine aminocarboxypropyltransferase 1 n=1 Tax=Tetradesmus obliquus TaxID=3088 RepID=A0ABY8THW2_TETOB|nr:hypothetical protein OEZ85_008106 [Tetradesmus obliquus]
MSSEQSVAKFAARRPDWELPQLQLEQLQLHPFDALRQATSRQPCPKCHKSRFLYCYDCAVPFTAIPSLQLPFQLSIITHHAELASKNTGVMAAILCPQQVQLHSIDQMPACDPAQCAVMFPSDDALLPDQLNLQQLQRVVILDSKWAKAKELNEHPALQGMARVKLPGCPKSCFWRFHTSGVTDEGMCSIEALHLLLRALAERLPDPSQRSPHHFDNLLWYFAFQHQLRTGTTRVSLSDTGSFEEGMPSRTDPETHVPSHIG